MATLSTLATATTAAMAVAKDASPLARLMAAHPRLFRGLAPVCWSDEVPAGWLSLIDEVCSGIESLLTPEQLASFEVLQIKQKLGGLRFYWRLPPAKHSEPCEAEVRSKPQGCRAMAEPGSSDATVTAIHDLVAAAYEASLRTCELCGVPGGQIFMEGMLVTRCCQHVICGAK